MDGANDRLAGSGELAEEANEVESRLSVQATGGLVEEEKSLGARGEFYTDGQALASYTTRTRSAQARTCDERNRAAPSTPSVNTKASDRS